MGSREDERPPSGVGGDDTPTTDDAGPSLARGEAVLIVGLLVSVLGIVALGTGLMGPLLSTGVDGGPAATPASPAPTATTTETVSPATPALTMQVRSVEACGTRCRSVTVALSNNGAVPARDVSATTRITADGSPVWEGGSDVGRLAAGETVTRTRTVEVDYLDAARIEAANGVVRIETTVRTATGTRVFTERRDVS